MPQVMQISEEEEAQLLKEQAEVVKVESTNMKRCFDQNKMTDGLKHASNLLNEMRTSVLSPKSYYTLYMLVTEQLRCFEQFIIEEHGRGHKISDLYELVQYCGNIIPRLYLIVTVGSAFIKTHLLSKRDVLRDLVEMCRGVQHPLRGLFLRKYLLEMTKNLLPDNLDTNATDGNVQDATEFALLNFAETNKLWVRMQHLGHSRERDRREQERRDLKLVVGTNLMVLSQLESVSVDMYAKHILPALLEQIVSCRDAIAQEYLMECLIQVFPDEFQLETLDQFLHACSELQPEVNVKQIVIQLITRLANFAKQGSTGGTSAIPERINLFQIFSGNISEIIASHPNMPLEGVVQLQSALLDLALSCYPDRADLIDTVLHTTDASLGAQLSGGQTGSTPETCQVKVEFATAAGRELVKLLRAIVDHYHGKILSLLGLTNFANVINWIDFAARRQVLLYVVNQALEANETLQTPDHVQKSLALLNSLILGIQSVTGASGAGKTGSAVSDPEDVHEEQTSIGRFLHLIAPTIEGNSGVSALDQHFLMLSAAKKILLTPGATSERLQFTLPPLIFQAIKLAHRYETDRESDAQWEAKVEKIFQFVHSLCVAIGRAEQLAELAMRLFLSGSIAVDRLKHFGNREKIAYEFYSQAFSIYEEEVTDSRAQQAALSLLIGALEQMSCFTAENHEPLRTKAAQAATKLLKKPDQTRAVGQCAHLFWSARVLADNEAVPLREGKRVAECLKRGLKIASQSMDDLLTVQLHVELLSHFVYFRQQGCADVKPAMLSQLAAKILEGLEPIGDREDAVATRRHFDCLTAFVRSQIQANDPEFSEVTV